MEYLYFNGNKVPYSCVSCETIEYEGTHNIEYYDKTCRANTTNGNVTFNLPSANDKLCRKLYFVYDVGSTNDVIINCVEGDTFQNGYTTYTMSNLYDMVELTSYKENCWFVIECSGSGTYS